MREKKDSIFKMIFSRCQYEQLYPMCLVGTSFHERTISFQSNFKKTRIP